MSLGKEGRPCERSARIAGTCAHADTFSGRSKHSFHNHSGSQHKRFKGLPRGTIPLLTAPAVTAMSAGTMRHTLSEINHSFHACRMACFDFHSPSLYGGTGWDVEGEWQRELDAIDINEHPAEPDDQGTTGVELAKEEKKGPCEEDSCTSLQNLLTRWHEREQKLQAFHQSLDEIGVWTSIGTVEQCDATVCTRTCPAAVGVADCPQVAHKDFTVRDASVLCESHTRDAVLHPSIDTFEPVQLVKCGKSIEGLLVDSREKFGGLNLSGSEDAVAERYRERAEGLHEYRIAGMERSRQRDLKQQTEGEVACKKLAIVAQKKKNLKLEQANKLAELERERILEARLFEEEQKLALDLLQAQDNAVEHKSKALQEMVMSIKAREEEMVKSRLEYQAAQDQTFFNEARRYLAGKKILQALKHRRSRIQRCCTRIQAEARQYLCRKKLKELQHQKLEDDGIKYPSPVAELTVIGNVPESERNEDLVLQLTTGNVQLKVLKQQQLFRKALKVGVKAGTSYEPLKTATAVTSVAKLEVAHGDDYEFQYEDDIVVHSEKERLIIWLKQITDGWEVPRCEALKMIQEARSIGLLTLATVVETVISDREKTVIANLEGSLAGGSWRAFQHWLTKARKYGLKEVVSKCCRSYEERLEKTKQNLCHLAQKGSRLDYMAAFSTAHSLGLDCEVEEAAKAVLKRALHVVRTTTTQMKVARDGGKLLESGISAQKTASSLGIGLNILEYIKRFSSEASVSNLARGAVILEADLSWETPKAVEKLHNGLHEFSKPRTGSAEVCHWHLEQWLTNDGLPQIIDSRTELGRWLIHEDSCIWSFNQNWSEIDELRSTWQKRMLDSRAVLRPTDLQNTAIQTVQSQYMFSKCEDPIQGEGPNHHREEVECNVRARRNNLDGRSQRAGNGKFEALEDTVVIDMDDESEDDERSNLELVFRMPVSFLVRSDDNFEWERTLCMPLVLTKSILEQKASCLGTDLQRLKKLDLTYDGLSSIAEGSLGQWCPALRFLVLDRNKLTTLRGLKGCEGHLEHISAKDNFISDFAGLESLPHLTSLHLEGNALRRLMSAISMLPDKVVSRAGTTRDQDGFGFNKSINDTHITSGRDTLRDTLLPVTHGSPCQRPTREKIPSPIRRRQVKVHDDGGGLPHGSWPKLKELGLSCNKLAGIVRLGSICPRLEVLDLSSNQLVTLGVDEGDALAGLACLRVLDVGQNKLKGRSLWDSLKHCPLLLSLVASRNRLSELPTHPGNVFLREIWLNGNAIRRLACKAWLPNLRRLYLQDNSINYLEPLWGCPALEVLDLSFNNISDLWQLRQLACFSSLRTLQLNDNPVSEQTDYVDKVLEAVPWLVELDNEPISEPSKDKAVRTIFLKVMDAVGPRYLKENLENLLAHGATARCQSLLFRRTPTSLNALLNGLADRETLWAIMCNIMLSAQTNIFLRTQLGIQGLTVQQDAKEQLCPNNVEAKWNVFAFQQMGSIHRQRLQTSYREQTLDDCKVRELGMDMLAFPNTRSFPNDPSVFSLDAPAETEISRLSRGKYDPEQYLADHINFCPGTYKEMLRIETEYSSDMDTQRRNIVKLQALARRFVCKLRFKQLCEERELEMLRKIEQLKQEARKIENSICRIQGLWRGRKMRREGLLLSLREEALRGLVLSNHATRIQAAWRGCRIRSKFRQALSRCKYVDNDEYDYISVDEEEFAMDDSFLEERVTTGVDDVTYPGVEFVLGKKKPNRVESDVRVAAQSPDTRHEKRWVTGLRSSSVPGDNGWLNAALPVPACTVSSHDSPRKYISRVATAPVRPTRSKTRDDPVLQTIHQSQQRSKQEARDVNRPSPPKPAKFNSSKTRKNLKDKVCDSNSKTRKELSSNGRRDQTTAWSDHHPYLQRAHEKKKAVAEIVKDWGFKDEKTAQSFLKAREKAKGHARAKGEAFKALLQDPQERLNIFKARTEVRASQVLEAGPLRTRQRRLSDGFAIQTTSSSPELQKAQSGCCSTSSEGATPAMDRSQCSSKSSVRGVLQKPGVLLEPRSVTASSTTLDLRPVAITPESLPTQHTMAKRKIKTFSFR